MKLLESDIEKAAGLIINEDGIDALTVDSLRQQMRISNDELLNHFKSDGDILKFMAQRLENEIQQLIHNLTAMHHEPEKELADLFKSLYDFFNRKSYFLELMFSDLIRVNKNAAAIILLRVKQDIRNYLVQILEQGEQTGVFNFNVSAKHEAESILSRFRFFMSDIPMTHKMLRDLKNIREEREERE